MKNINKLLESFSSLEDDIASYRPNRLEAIDKSLKSFLLRNLNESVSSPRVIGVYDFSENLNFNDFVVRVNDKQMFAVSGEKVKVNEAGRVFLENQKTIKKSDLIDILKESKDNIEVLVIA